MTALNSALAELPAELRRTLTWDRGSEMAQHDAVARLFLEGVFFADPGSPWMRGTNENTVSVVVGPGGPVRQAGAGSTE